MYFEPFFQASRSESPRAIQTSSGNDALIDELKSILNSAQKDQTDFFDFDDINNSGISNKRKAALRKKQQEGRSSTTKRAPEHFDENFVLDDETEEPLTLKPGTFITFFKYSWKLIYKVFNINSFKAFIHLVEMETFNNFNYNSFNKSKTLWVKTAEKGRLRRSRTKHN